MSIFTEVLKEKPARSSYNIPYSHLTTGNMGKLIPIMNMEVVPGDHIKITPYNLIKFQPLLAPILHNIEVRIDFFYVPNRIIWDGFNNFITQKKELVHPYVRYDSYIAGTDLNIIAKPGTVGDYFNLPQRYSGAYEPGRPGEKINPIRLSAYYYIYAEYYGDQNLEDLDALKDAFELGEGDHTELSPGKCIVFPPQNAAWMHDYFTSCLPYAQKGTAVLMPLTDTSQIDVIMKESQIGQEGVRLYDLDDEAAQFANLISFSTGEPDEAGMFTQSASTKQLKIDPNGTMYVNVNEAAQTIATLRNSIALQHYLEILSRSGTRINEWTEGIFNQTISDTRAQRPEYIGGSKQLVTVNEIIANSQTAVSLNDEAVITNPAGQYAGNAYAADKGQTFEYHIEEYGYIIGMLTVRPETSYMNGLHRSWSRLDPYDYYLPQFENIGEQAVLNKEVLFPQANPNGVFGYIPRNAEYKFKNNVFSGEMTKSLDYWHLGRQFAQETPPALNMDFIRCNPRKNSFAVQSPDEHELIINFYADVHANRPMQKFANPKIVG